MVEFGLFYVTVVPQAKIASFVLNSGRLPWWGSELSLFCFAAFLLSHHTNEQPRESPVSVDCYAALLLWTGSCLLCHRLHTWHAHLGFHGCRGKVLGTVIRFLNTFKETRLFEKVFGL